MRKPGTSIAGTRHGLYGPTRGTTRDEHRRVVPRVAFDASTSVCGALPPAVAGRYFGAPHGSFEAATARTMCARCPVRVDCLTDAITGPQAGMIRGGEPPHAQAALRAEHERSGVSARRIAERVAGHQLPPLRGAYGSPALRAGRFTSPAVRP